MPFIETNRLILRNVAAKDADIMYDYRNNEICARYQRGQIAEAQKRGIYTPKEMTLVSHVEYEKK